MIRAVLFDFDGVVVQSEALHMKTFLELLTPYGVKVSEARWYREFAGTGSRHIFEVLCSEFRVPEDVGALVETRKKLYEGHVRGGALRETPGVRGFLSALQKRGIACAIVSGSHRSNVKLALSLLKLEPYFSLIVSGDDLEKRKPDPEPFLHAARRLGVPPSECLVVEDSVPGCEAAKRAGMRLVAIRSPASEALYGYDAMINDFTEFPLEMLS
jgi:HAD superfamily hydrolase (TIGR01509 family)